jgi:hypothetical protein
VVNVRVLRFLRGSVVASYGMLDIFLDGGVSREVVAGRGCCCWLLMFRRRPLIVDRRRCQDHWHAGAGATGVTTISCTCCIKINTYSSKTSDSHISTPYFVLSNK